jgi:flagellin FlaB
MHKAVKLYLKDDDKAAIGIGTLIVFIALVLVAAIAAAVIIQTAYSLKNQAEVVGEGARREVAGSFKILSVVGDRDPTGSGTNEATVDTIWFYVTSWDGSKGIDIDKTRIVIRTSNTLAEQTLDTVGGADANNYDATEIPTPDPDPTDDGWDPGNGMYFLDADNILRIEIDLDAIGGGGGGNGVSPNTFMTIQLMPGSGPVVTEDFITPASYGGDRYIDLTTA